MSGVSMKVRSREVLGMLFGVRARMEDRPALLKIAGQILVTSIQRNFEVGGRPTKWAPLSPVTLKRRKGNKPLVVKGMGGGLMGSIHYVVEGDKLKVGTPKVQGGTLHFGAKKGAFGTVAVKVAAHTRVTEKYGEIAVKAHTRNQAIPWGDIPARNFVVVQDEDRVNIQRTAQDFLLGRGR